MTDTSAVADWPHIQALTRPDGTGELTINGTSHPIETSTTQQARDEIVRRVVETATNINRPVRVATTGPEGDWPLIVHPDGKIEPDLLAGATFTVSNLGGFGIESFTPLLNVPQVAILGVDAIFPRATIDEDGSVGVEQRIGFSLTADHRVIDGADAARFLQDLVKAIENIDITALA